MFANQFGGLAFDTIQSHNSIFSHIFTKQTHHSLPIPSSFPLQHEGLKISVWQFWFQPYVRHISWKLWQFASWHQLAHFYYDLLKKIFPFSYSCICFSCTYLSAGDAHCDGIPGSTANWDPGALCNIGYPSETHLKLKSCEISFVYNSYLSWPIVLRFFTEHGSITAVLCAKFQIDWTIETDIMDEQDFTKF